MRRAVDHFRPPLFAAPWLLRVQKVPAVVVDGVGLLSTVRTDVRVVMRTWLVECLEMLVGWEGLSLPGLWSEAGLAWLLT